MSLRDLLPSQHPHPQQKEGHRPRERPLPGLEILFVGRDARSAAIAETVERIIAASRHHDRLRRDPATANVRARLHLLSQAEDALRQRPRLLVIDDRPDGHDQPPPPYCGPGGHILLPLSQVEAQLIPLIAELLPY